MTETLFSQMITIKERVKYLLQKHEHLRDSDKKLIATFLKFELIRKGINPEEISGKELLQMVASGKVSLPESIRRIRQKLQEQNPELRGKHYKSRKQQAEFVRENIHDL